MLRAPSTPQDLKLEPSEKTIPRRATRAKYSCRLSEMPAENPFNAAYLLLPAYSPSELQDPRCSLSRWMPQISEK